MIDRLNALFRALSPLWEMSLTAAYAAAVVAALRLILKKRAPRQVACLLWLVVFARLLVPAALESPVSIVPDALPRQEQTLTEHTAPPDAAGGTASVQNPAQGQPTDGAAVNPVVQGGVPVLTAPEGTAPAVPSAPEVPAPFPLRAALAGVWLAGALAMGGYGLLSYLGLRRRLFDAIRAADGAWEHPSVASPFILGVVRPRIYLPAGLAGRPRQFILCHERAHLRRLDHIVKPVCWLALALHWFNPAVWLAFTLMSRDIEAACDEAVLRRLGTGVKADYSATLLSLATRGRVPAPCPLAFDEGDAKGRIQNVLRYRRPALWIVVVSVIMAVMAAVCLLTDPVSAKTPDGGPEPSASPSAPASQPPEEPGLPDSDAWMLEVLSGERAFLSTTHSDSPSQAFTVNDLRAFYYGDQFPEMKVTVGSVAIIDLDRDGVNELVVWPEGDDGYLYSAVGYVILRRQGDAVYGYNPVYRAFGLLKSDGTFHWSNSAFNSGTGRALFTENGFEVQDITWCEIHSETDERYFVNGVKATKEEFEAACAAWQEFPEPVWYVYQDGNLFYAPIRVPIPLDEAARSVPVPDFLDANQQKLYREAYMMYTRLFGCSSESADDWPGHPRSYGGVAPVSYDGAEYIPFTGLYADWDDFEEAALSVFTDLFWHLKNWNGENASYVNIGGVTHYLDWGRGGGGYNENFPETFRLVERTEDTISFVLTGYYSEMRTLPGETDAQRDARVAAGWEYSIDYPMRLEKTAQGWRFGEFHNPRTDNGVYPFYTDAAHVPNPDAPERPAAPEPTPTPEPVVLSEGEGMRLLGTTEGIRLVWDENGQAFPVGPDAPSPNYNPWLEDFDLDGQLEALFPAEGSFPFTIYDFVGNALLGYPLDIDLDQVYDSISRNAVAAYNPDTRGLTVTYLWDGAYTSSSTTLPEDFFAGCEELADGRPLYAAVRRGGVNGMGVEPTLWYRAQVLLTDGNATSPVVGTMFFTVRYSDSGFALDPPGEIEWLPDYVP